METMYFVDRVHGMSRASSAAVNRPDDVLRSVREVVPDAANAAVVGDDAAAVAVNEAEDEFFGGLIDECLLPGLEPDGPVGLAAGAVLGQ
jgi:hypothetical protein